MFRTPFARTWTPAPKLRDREPALACTVKPVSRGTYAANEGRAMPKAPRPVRSEKYRRRVAALPCFQCGIQGFSQAAHPNHGKARGRKQSDLECFPLCCTRPGEPGCHYRFDQFQIVSRVDMPAFEQRAAAWTKHQLETAA